MNADTFRNRFATAVVELRTEAVASGIQWGGRNDKVRKGSHAARLRNEITVFRMMGGLLLARVGVTVDEARELASAGVAVVHVDRHRHPETIKVKA